MFNVNFSGPFSECNLVREFNVEDFFSSVGKVRDVKLIVCNKTHRFKGIFYVEFKIQGNFFWWTQVSYSSFTNSLKICTNFVHSFWAGSDEKKVAEFSACPKQDFYTHSCDVSGKKFKPEVAVKVFTS